MKFGIKTDTGDITGNVIDDRVASISKENLDEVSMTLTSHFLAALKYFSTACCKILSPVIM